MNNNNGKKFEIKIPVPNYNFPISSKEEKEDFYHCVLCDAFLNRKSIKRHNRTFHPLIDKWSNAVTKTHPFPNRNIDKHRIINTTQGGFDSPATVMELRVVTFLRNNQIQKHWHPLEDVLGSHAAQNYILYNTDFFGLGILQLASQIDTVKKYINPIEILQCPACKEHVAAGACATFLHKKNVLADKMHFCCLDCLFSIRKVSVQNLPTRGQIVPGVKTHNCMECRELGTYTRMFFQF